MVKSHECMILDMGDCSVSVYVCVHVCVCVCAYCVCLCDHISEYVVLVNTSISVVDDQETLQDPSIKPVIVKGGK